MPAAAFAFTALILAQSADPAWHTDYSKAQSEARKAGKPILAVLH